MQTSRTAFVGRPEDVLADLPKTCSLLVDDLQLADAKESLALPRGTTDCTQHPQTCSINLSIAGNRIHRELCSISKDLVLCAELFFLAELLFRHASFPSNHRNAVTPLLDVACIFAVALSLAAEILSKAQINNAS